MVIVELYTFEGQVTYEKRGNILEELSIDSLIFSSNTLIESEEGNLYICNFGDANGSIQKFTKDGKYVCSYLVSGRVKKFYFEKGLFYVYGDSYLYTYDNEELLSVTEVANNDVEKFENMEQESSGYRRFWTVYLNDGQVIHLEKCLFPDYSFQKCNFSMWLFFLLAILKQRKDKTEDQNGYLTIK